METVNYKDLVAIGFPEHTSRNIIRQAKKIAVKKFEEARKLEEEKEKDLEAFSSFMDFDF